MFEFARKGYIINAFTYRRVASMVCPECSYENPETSVQCAKCTTPLPLSDQTLATSGQGWSVPAADGVVSDTALIQLSPGTSVGSRYEVVRLPMHNGHATGEYEDFMTDFVTPSGDVWGRPVGVTMMNDGTLLVSDDASKSIWRISYVGAASK